MTIPEDRWWMCPYCGADLTKKKDTGPGIRHCPSCGRNWYILNTSQDDIPTPKRTGPPLTMKQADDVLKKVYGEMFS